MKLNVKKNQNSPF